jgi:hypothetical protein
VFLDLRIVKELRGCFSDLLILRGLTFVVLARGSLSDSVGGRSRVLASKVGECCQQTRERIARMYSMH